MTSSFDLGQQSLQSGHPDEAIVHFREASKEQPTNPYPWFFRGLAEMQIPRLTEAQRAFRKAIQLRPTSADFHYEYGMSLRHDGKLDQALDAFDKALEKYADEPHFVAGRAETLRLQGHFDEAASTIAPLIEQGVVERRLAMVYARLAHRTGNVTEAIELLHRVLEAEHPEGAIRSNLAFTLGRLYDRNDDVDQAFDWYRQANDNAPGTFDISGWERAVTRMTKAWTTDTVQELPRARVTKRGLPELPVFILGMPRSGTSLVERIVAAHPDTAAGGERNALNEIAHRLQEAATSNAVMLERPEVLRQPIADKHAKAYLRDLRSVSRDALRITDKMPTNFMHLGLIASLFPDARIIHCQRNPLDTCLSCFFQEFSAQLAWSTDLDALGRFHSCYEQLMTHWQTVLTDNSPAVLNVRYHDLVTTPEPITREIIEFIGLPWDDACLRHHEHAETTITASNEQVRQPIYTTAVGRHERYRHHLEPLISALEGGS